METAPEKAMADDIGILYTMYKDLPVGAVLVDSSMKILSSNKCMCGYFPEWKEGIDGMSVCKVLGCTPETHKCVKCGLKKIIKCSLSENIVCKSFVMETAGGKWFKINGIPLKYGDASYAALFFSDITEQKLSEKSLLAKLELDQHTKALNKRALMDYTDAMLKDKGRKPFTICMVDFDNFKNINDTCGHLAGDKVLETFSDIARKNIRSADIFARFGGEEFVFIFIGAGTAQSVKIIKRIQDELYSSFAGKLPMPVTFSAGAVYAAADGRFTRESLFSAVDKLLYKAKSEGKRRVEAC